MATLYIHIGHGKTGSSWIQTCLRMSRDALLQKGILYAPGDDRYLNHPNRITSGNGSNLFKSKIDFENHLKENQNREVASLLFSSEHIFWDIIESDADRYLEETAKVHGFDQVKLLLFIRNPIAMAVSIWQQRIKRRGDHDVTLSNLHERMEIGYDSVVFVEELFTRLKKYSHVDLTVRNYSVCRDRLIEVTAEWLGVPAGIFTQPAIRRVNRSLTWSELVFQKSLNSIIGPSGNLFSDPLCENLPDMEHEPIFPPVALQKAIWDKLSPHIERINDQIPENHRYQCDIQEPFSPPDKLTFSPEQINIISESLGNEILRLRNLHSDYIPVKGIVVSVIISNYNYGQYLEQCLISVLASDFDPSKLEIILVDDASSDNSLEVARRITAGKTQHARIMTNQVNLGVIRCRNLGIAHASGEFLYILDADNYIHRDCLKTGTDFLMQNPEFSACYAPVRDFRSDTGEFLGTRSDKPFNYQQLLEMPYIDAMAMFRRSDLMAAGMYDSGMPPYGWEDYELWLRLGKQGRRVAYLSGEPLSYYRSHERNKSQHYKPDQFNHLVYYLKQKYGVRINYLPTAGIAHLIHQEKTNVQLYYQTPGTDFSEQKSLIQEAGQDGFHFRLPPGMMIQRLRFDPYNQSTIFKFRDIHFFCQGEELVTYFTVSSNSIKISGTTWYFADHDPQIIFDFLQPLIIDEIQIDIRYLNRETEVVEEIERSVNRKSDQIKVLQHKIASLQSQIHQKDREPEIRYQVVFQKKYTGLTTKLLNRRNLTLINNSGLFDADYYLRANRDVSESGMDPVKHYLMHGGGEGRNPSENFDAHWYLKTYPDVAASGINPLLHYLLHGKKEGRLPKNKEFRPVSVHSQKKELVSIIMPAFNASGTIEFSIRSLQNQTYREFELIVVDDGSEDDTAAIAERAASTDNRITVLNLPENRGAYEARNHGIRRARGRFITFHDADDIALPERIEFQVMGLMEGTIQFSIPGFVRTRFSIADLSMSKDHEVMDMLQRVMRRPGSDSAGYHTLRPCLSMTMFRREIFEQHGLYWATRFAGDAEFIERIMRHESGVTFNDQNNELRTFIMQEKHSEGLYNFISKPLIVCPEKSPGNLTVKFPMGGHVRDSFKRIWKNRLNGIGEYEYPQL